MEFTSFSIEACEPAADGGVVPGLVPVPNVDPDALEEAAGRFRAIGEAIEESGADIASTWASLTGIYVAPEADTLLSALDPVPSDGTSVATAIGDAATALETFAETAREIKSRLNGLKAEAEAFRADVGWDDEWLDDEDERERNNDLNNRIATAVHEFQEAERDCANKIGEHYGGTFFTGHSDKAAFDQTKSNGERSWQVYGTAAARTGEANPWGSPVDAPTSAFEDAFWGLGDIAIGAVVGLGVGTGLYRDGRFAYPFGTEHGQNMLANWDDAQESFWALTGSDAQGEWSAPGSADAQYENARGPWLEVGDSIVPVSEWDDRPMYTITNGAGNAALMLTPMGWARTFLDGSGAGSGPNPDGSLPADRGPNGVGGHGGGLHGTDTVGVSTGSPAAGRPDTGNSIGGMHESLTGLQSRLEGASAPEPGVPTGSPTPAPVSTPEAPGGPTAPSGDIPSPNGGGAPTTAPEPVTVPPGGGGDTAREGSGPTAQELHDATADSGADTSGAPWTASPVDDGSAPSPESPTTPVGAPAGRTGAEGGGATAFNDTSGGTDLGAVRDDASDGASNDGSTGPATVDAAGDHAVRHEGEESPTPEASGGGSHSGSGTDVPGTGGGGPDDAPDDSFYFSEGDRNEESGFTTRRDTSGNLSPEDTDLYNDTLRELGNVGLSEDNQRQIMDMLQTNETQEGRSVARIISSGSLNGFQGYGSFLTKFASPRTDVFTGAAAELRFAFDLANRPGSTQDRDLLFPASGRANDDVDTMITGDTREDHFSYQVKSINSVGGIRKHLPKIINQLSGETAMNTRKVAIIEVNSSIDNFHEKPYLKNIVKHNADQHSVGFRIFFRDGVVTIPPDTVIYP